MAIFSVLFAIASTSLSTCLAYSMHSMHNSTTLDPILPGFHPDPSCIFVPECDNTFFCASSSFNAFPGIPVHASKDLQNWKLITNVLNRPEQLPVLGRSNGSTSGIWAPTLRYHNDTFWVVTTMVHDKQADDDPTRWDNVIFQAKDIYDPLSWSNAVHFNFTGYDTSPYWDTDGSTYMTGSHAWKVKPGIQQTTIDLNTGKLGGEFKEIWAGTGGEAPEGPHIYHKDDYYYLLAAEGGTGLGHMVTMARSKEISGPYEANPANPVLTNANTTSYFQTVGHADLFQDSKSNWWGVALSTRSGPEYVSYPMGRETVLTPVSWEDGQWPIWTNVSGIETSWPLPPQDKDIRGSGPFINEPDSISFSPGTKLPAHFLYWRFPDPEAYTISPSGHLRTLRLTPSKLNLTALDGNYASSPQTFISRRQTDTLFTYGVTLDYHPTMRNEEAGITAFLTQNHHIRMGITMLSPANESTAIPHFSFYAISYIPVPMPFTVPVPEAWRGKKLRLEIRAPNETHYAFRAGPVGDKQKMQTIAWAPTAVNSWGFTGTLLGIYATSNGGNGSTQAYFSNWVYEPQGQKRD